jgi:hypothetical protein
VDLGYFAQGAFSPEEAEPPFRKRDWKPLKILLETAFWSGFETNYSLFPESLNLLGPKSGWNY